MLDCTKNAFCASLPDATRNKLCTRCHRRLTKAGSTRLYDYFNREVSIILDGIVCGSAQITAGDIWPAPDAQPMFALCLPGRPLALDVTFNGWDLVSNFPRSFNDVRCLTDCCFAVFDHALFRDLFKNDPDFAWALNYATLMLVGDIGWFAALMRAESVFAKASLLMQLLEECSLYLPRQTISDVLACNRTSVSRAVAKIEREQPEFFARYVANKNRAVDYYR